MRRWERQTRYIRTLVSMVLSFQLAMGGIPIQAFAEVGGSANQYDDKVTSQEGEVPSISIQDAGISEQTEDVSILEDRQLDESDPEEGNADFPEHRVLAAYHTAIESGIAKEASLEVMPVEQMGSTQPADRAKALFEASLTALSASGDSSDKPMLEQVYGEAPSSSEVAGTFAAIAQELEVNCLVVGSETGSIYWNLVEIGDDWFHVDVFAAANELLVSANGEQDARTLAERWLLVGDETLTVNDATRVDWTIVSEHVDQESVFASPSNYDWEPSKTIEQTEQPAEGKGENLPTEAVESGQHVASEVDGSVFETTEDPDADEDFEQGPQGKALSGHEDNHDGGIGMPLRTYCIGSGRQGIHVWASFDKLGSTTVDNETDLTGRTVYSGDTVYVNWRLERNGGQWNPTENYTVAKCVYNPDGSVYFNPDPSSNVIRGSLTLHPQKTGLYTAKISVYGGISFETTIGFYVNDTVPSITSQPSSAMVASGSSTTFRVAASGTNLQYQWRYRMPDSSSWTEISGATSSSYTVTASSSNSGYAYDCKVSNSAGVRYTNTVYLTTTYKMFYYANRGSGAPAAQTKVHGQSLTLSSEVPTRSGYTFVGWWWYYSPYESGYYDSNSGSFDYSPGQTIDVNANRYLYAVWRKDITLSYNANNGSGAPSAQNISVYNATTDYTFTISQTKPMRSGYSFLGWSTSSSATSANSNYDPGKSVTLSSDLSLYAVWKPSSTSISSCSMTFSPSSYTYDGTQKTPTVIVKDGSKTLVKDTDYTVAWPGGRTNAGTYTVTVTGKGNYRETKSASFTITKATPTLTFANSTVNKKTSDGVFTNNLTKLTDGVVTFESSNKNVATVDSNTGKVTIKGEGEATITARASEGTNYNSGSASFILTVAKPTSYTITFDANGGTGTPSPQYKDKDVTLTLSSVKPAKSYVIRYNACGGSVSPASKSVSATFRGWNTQRNGSGTSYASGDSYTINAGATLYAQWSDPMAGTLATPSRSGFDFAGWFTSATGGSRVSSTFTVTENTTVYAHWTDPYNLGDETYSFRNYSDSDADGHCFGMSITSAGYHNNLLDIRRIGGNENTPLYSFDASSVVTRPICYYQGIQGSYSKRAIVAGGSYYLGKGYDIASDWHAVVERVKDHSYDGTGLLQIGFRGMTSRNREAGHAINFLRYEKVNGQDRLYAYDNNNPREETYFYQDSHGRVLEAPYQTFVGALKCITLRDVRTYFSVAGDFDATHVLYVAKDAATVQGYSYSYMEGGLSDVEYVMYEIPAGQDRVTIIPHEDYADFIYMNTEYSFGKVTDETRGVLRFASLDEGSANPGETFTIYEDGSSIPTVTLSKAKYTYDGAVHKPKVTVRVGGATLKASTDYTVKYPSGMIDVGKYEVKVTLKGKYSGTVVKAFTIAKADQSITASNKSVAAGKTVSLGAKTSGAGKLTYKSSDTSVATVSAKGVVTGKKAGTAKVTITAAATANYNQATKTVKVTVKVENTLSAKAKKSTIAASFTTLKSKAVTLASNVTVTMAKGAVTYTNVSTNATAKKFKVDAATGKLTVPKGTQKGEYEVRVKVSAKGDATYLSGAKTVAFYVQVK